MGQRWLDEIPDAIVVTTTAGVVTYWNPGAERMFGYAAAEARGRTLDEIIIPPDRVDAERRLQAESRAVGADTYESLRQHKDGSLIHVDISTRSVKGDDTEPDAVLTSMKDVTRLKLTRDFRLVEARFGSLLESMPDGILVANEAGLIVLANAQAERMFGYDSGELNGQAIEILLPSRLRAAHLRHRTRFTAQPRLRSMGAGLELHGVRKDGSEFPVEISLSPIATDEGTLVMSAVRDIGDRKKAESKFRGLLESAPDAMVIVDQSGSIVLINSQTEKMFGYPRAELLGQPVEILVPARFRARHPEHREVFFAQPRARAMGAGHGGPATLSEPRPHHLWLL